MIIQPNNHRKTTKTTTETNRSIVDCNLCEEVRELVARRQAGRKTGNTAVQGEQVFARAEKAAITAKGRKEGDSKSASSR